MTKVKILSDSCFSISKRVVYREVKDEIIILNLKKNLYYSLDGAGTLIWKWIIKGITLEKVAVSLAERYDVDEKTALKDLNKLIKELIDEEVIVMKE